MSASPFNPYVSIFPHAKANMPDGVESLHDLIATLRSSVYAGAVNQMRKAADKKERTELKKQLPAVTWAGTFTKRNKEGLSDYSGIICHDIDELEEEALKELWHNLINCSWTLAAFVSPSGNGIKVLYQVESGPDDHLYNWQAFANMLRARWGAIVDESTKDICRLCFLTHDPAAYYAPKAAPMPASVLKMWFEHEFKESEDVPELEPKDFPAAQPKPAIAAGQEPNYLERVHEIVQKTVQAGPGHHNRYAGQYAQQANRYGIPMHECLAELSRYMPAYNAKELASTVQHHYNKAEEAARHGEYLRNIEQRRGGGGTRSRQRSYSSDGEASYSAFDDSVKFWYLVGKIDKATGDILVDATTGEPLGEYRYSYDDAIAFLQSNGFYKYRGENNTYQLIKVDKRAKQVEIVIDRQVKEFMLDFLKSSPSAEFKRVREMFRRGAKNYCSLSMLEGLDYYNPRLRKDTKDAGYIYFKNCFLEVTAEGIRSHSYTEQDNYIWSQQIKPFHYNPAVGEDADFARFLRYAITGRKATPEQPYTEKENEMYLAALTSLGYLLHRYKDPVLTKAVITTDKALRSGTENEGRSGKSLVGKALEHMLICTSIDGRNFSFDKDFAFQKVNIDTQLINFNDIRQKFDFTRLFGMITEEFTFEKKGKDMITIPFADAPKFYISSNSTLRGEGSSTRARQQIIEFTNYFNDQHTPVVEFGRRFFSGWDAEEWCRFYNLMAHCLHLYLKEGLKDFPLENYAINALYEQPGAGEEFIDYMQDVVMDNLKFSRGEFDSTVLFEKYKEKTTQKVDWLKKNTFTKWVKEWAKIKGLTINAHRPDGRDKRGGVDYLTFTPIGGAAVEPPTNPDGSTELPF